MLHVMDLGATVDGDRRRQPRIEELALVVAEDHDRLRLDRFKLLAELIERPATLLEAALADVGFDLRRKAGRTLLQQRVEIVGLAAIPVYLVFAIRLRPQVPLLSGGR